MKKVHAGIAGFLIGSAVAGTVLFVVRSPEARSYKDRPVLVVVLGCRPLDDKTPSLDMVRRVERGVEVVNAEGPRALLLLTGGRTVGKKSEAGMMADLAVKYGIPRSRLLLEERSTSTEENARFSKRRLGRVRPAVLILVSRPGHRGRALKAFRSAFPDSPVRFVASRITREGIAEDLARYLAVREDPEVRRRLGLVGTMEV